MKLNGIMFRDMIFSAANNIENNKQIINDLNVFPVPDGDTGTNMSLTMSSAKNELSDTDETEVGIVADRVASALLKGARGNSGVILSLLFRGFAKELTGIKEANGEDIAIALISGVKSAYGAVMKPTEGTMLTVARLSSDAALELSKTNKDILQVFEEIIKVSEETLAKTPDMLPVLKQANVVDAGGKGLIVIYDGMLSVLKDNIIIGVQEIIKEETADKADFNTFKTEDIAFAYCTEFIIKKKTGADSRNFQPFLYIMGDSIVAAEDGEIMKVHVHTNNPGRVLEEALALGYLTDIKIDNMKEQHTAISERDLTPMKMEVAESVKEYGFVAVSAGEGLAAVFKDLGVDNIIEGGQTMNPSTEDILRAINQTPSKIVFVLPNNKNIIMAAEQAATLTEKKVIVIPSNTIPQGISAMIEFMPEGTESDNEAVMKNAVSKVKTGQITFAVRDSVFDGKKIKKGEILGLIEDKVTFIEKNLENCALKITKELIKDGETFVTVFYGSDVSEKEALHIKEKLTAIVKGDVNVLRGGQPVYYYIISAE